LFVLLGLDGGEFPLQIGTSPLQGETGRVLKPANFLKRGKQKKLRGGTGEIQQREELVFKVVGGRGKKRKATLGFEGVHFRHVSNCLKTGGINLVK